MSQIISIKTYSPPTWILEYFLTRNYCLRLIPVARGKTTLVQLTQYLPRVYISGVHTYSHILVFKSVIHRFSLGGWTRLLFIAGRVGVGGVQGVGCGMV